MMSCTNSLSQIYCVWAFVIPILFNPDQANLGAKCGFIFGGISVPLLVYLWFYQVETKGRSYEELDEMFQKGIAVRDFKNYVSESQMREMETKGGDA
jgi:MFS transporter, SP family, general alpha glucoside:H+ symporter